MHVCSSSAAEDGEPALRHLTTPLPTFLSLSCRAGMAPRAGGRSSSRGEFGDPDRRLTDVLLVTNILMFGLQLATNQMATVWGMKVRAAMEAKAGCSRERRCRQAATGAGSSRPASVPLHARRALARPPLQVNQLIAAGQWWRFVTPAFLHGGIMHLVVNSYSLNNLGPAVENSVG